MIITIMWQTLTVSIYLFVYIYRQSKLVTKKCMRQPFCIEMLFVAIVRCVLTRLSSYQCIQFHKIFFFCLHISTVKKQMHFSIQISGAFRNNCTLLSMYKRFSPVTTPAQTRNALPHRLNTFLLNIETPVFPISSKQQTRKGCTIRLFTVLYYSTGLLKTNSYLSLW